ncbi:MAG: hypothetical protein ACM3WP_22495 [Acidobacteriota bacterium]
MKSKSLAEQAGFLTLQYASTKDRDFPMIAKALETEQVVLKDLRRCFEDAVRDIHSAELKGTVSQRRTPIAHRVLCESESAIGAEKRALSDAARALSALWKLAPNSGR